MTQAPAAIVKIPTESPQPARGKASRARKTAAAQPRAASRVAGIETRAATRGDGEVVELDLGITVYPPRQDGGRWRAVWHEDGERKQCESVSGEKLAAKLEKVRQRLAMGAANMTKPGADLIAWYLNPDRLPVAKRWSRKHAYTQRSLCQRFAVPVIGAVACQDITTVHAQKIVNAAPTASEGDRVHRMLSAMIGAGIKGGYLVSPMLAEVHWQAGDRLLPVPKVAGESALLVDHRDRCLDQADVVCAGRFMKRLARTSTAASSVAENSIRWPSGGVMSRSRRTAGRKPRPAMWSAASSTLISTSSR